MWARNEPKSGRNCSTVQLTKSKLLLYSASCNSRTVVICQSDNPYTSTVSRVTTTTLEYTSILLTTDWSSSENVTLGVRTENKGEKSQQALN